MTISKEELLKTFAERARKGGMRTVVAANQKDYFDKVFSADTETHSVACPCCLRDGVVYKRRLNSGMARVLIRLLRKSWELGRGYHGWVHVQELFQNGGQQHRDWSMLRHWGLIEARDVKTASDNASGWWRLTPAGVEFLYKRLEVPSHGLFYENRAIYWLETKTDIVGALGSRFDYVEVMGGVQ